MALLPLAIPIATTLIGSGLNAGQAVNASKRRKEAEAAADAAAAKMRAMRFEDTMAGLQIPMMGAEQSAEKQAQREAMQIQALQEAGGAAVLGGTPGLAAMGAEEDLARQAQIEQLEYARNLELARNQQRISDANLELQYGIEGMELTGAQRAAAQAESEKRAAIGSAASTIAQAGLDIYSTMPLYKKTADVASAAATKAAPSNTLTAQYASLGSVNPPQYGIGATPTPSYSSAIEVPTIGKELPYSPQLRNFVAPGNRFPSMVSGMSAANTPIVNRQQLPPSMGGYNLGAYDPFAAFSSPFSQYTTLQ
jgi:hypothetical protein